MEENTRLGVEGEGAEGEAWGVPEEKPAMDLAPGNGPPRAMAPGPTGRAAGREDRAGLGGPRRGSDPGARLHDFQRPRHISGERLRALDTVHRKFARAASSALSALVRARLEVDLISVSQRTFFDFISSLHNPTSLHVIYCVPFRIPFVLEMSPNILFPMMERLLGGRGDDRPHPARPFTRIEQGLARSISEHLLGELRKAWCAALPAGMTPLHEGPETPRCAMRGAATPPPADSSGESPLRFDIAEAEHNPLLMQIVEPSEPSVVLTFQATMTPGPSLPASRRLDALSAAGAGPGAGLSGPPGEVRGLPRCGQIHLALPTKLFEPIIAQLARSLGPGSGPEKNSPRERDRILQKLHGTKLTVTAELGSVPLTLPDLLALRPGDVIDTQLGRSTEVSLLFDGRKVFRGQPATHDGKRAVLITRCETEE
ncbi:MAG TPA: FliM/FliN family flagellar motor switch protein [Planctomycetota bacterium]|nr:FliM/FliN family flagellar motor switch protein [Planctomycetota bacterium]